MEREEKNLRIAKAKCGTDAPITVQVNVDSTVTGACLFFSVDYITMRVAGKDYSFSLGSDIREISDPTSTTSTNITPKQEEQLRRYEMQRLESRRAIGIRFLDLNLLEDPFKFGKVALLAGVIGFPI